MSFVGFIVRKAIPLPKIESFEKYLFIGPHADDIEIGAGATVAKLTKMGKEVHFLICIDGRFGVENLKEPVSSEELIEIRKEEAKASAKLLGVSSVTFLDLCDGGLYEEKDLFDKIAAVAGEIAPDILFYPDPDVASECHIDHLRVGKACKELAFLAPFEDIMKAHGAKAASVKAIAMYMTARPTVFVKTGKKCFEAQLKTLSESFKSQYPKDNPSLASLITYLKLRAHTYGAKRLCSYAEGFRVLGKTHMHCLPEMSPGDVV